MNEIPGDQHRDTVACKKHYLPITHRSHTGAVVAVASHSRIAENKQTCSLPTVSAELDIGIEHSHSFARHGAPSFRIHNKHFSQAAAAICKFMIWRGGTEKPEIKTPSDAFLCQFQFSEKESWVIVVVVKGA